MEKMERIRGRLIELEIGEAKGVGWVAIGIVRQGLAHEVGMRFEAKAGDAGEAERRLKGEIEACFS